MMKTWEGRFAEASDPLFEAFTSSVRQDQRLATYDLVVSRAHALALADAGVIDEADAQRLVAALHEIGAEIERGDFDWSDALEDVHTHVEDRLREKVGVLADSLHAGRSRNDQIAADLRLYVKDACREALARILDLQTALVDLARRYSRSLMPGYTHLQQAQPVLVALPLLGYAEMLTRDWTRMVQCFALANQSPLGAAALAGSTFPLDRQLLAREVGFPNQIENSLDAVSDRDFVVDFVYCAALCMTHLSRFAEDLVLWSSQEFGFVRLPDSFASGSSMMPQKKNPDVPELIRAKAALLIGDLTGLLTLLKGLPLGYNRDLQEDKTPLFHASDSLIDCLRVLAAMLPQLEFTERAEAAISSFTLATDLADHLVRKGVPFREAHSTVGGLVAACLASGRELTNLTKEELAAASPQFRDLPPLSSLASVQSKQTQGGTNPKEITRQLRGARAAIRRRRRYLDAIS